MTSGMELRLERVAARLRIGDIAAQMGVSRQTVSRWESAGAVPTPTAEAFRDAVRKSVEIRDAQVMQA